MMKELKFGVAHQKLILKNLHQGESLSSSDDKKQPILMKSAQTDWNDINYYRYKVPAKRTRECIVNSGAYEAETFIPSTRLCKMTYFI